MEKEGTSNIEMVIAFTLFIGAVFFAFYYLNEVKVDSPNIDYIYEIVRENVSIEQEVQTVFIYTNQENVAIPYDEEFGARVVSLDGEQVNSEIEGNIIYINSNGKEGVYIHSAPVYKTKYGSVSSKPEVNEEHYQFGSTSKNRLVSENNILVMNSSLDKNEFNNFIGLLPGERLNVILRFNETDFIKIEPGVSSGNVFSKRNRVEVIRNSGENVFADLEIQIWK